MKKLLLAIVIAGLALTMSSCAFFREPLDKISGFSKQLAHIEEQILEENWQEAANSLEKAVQAWFKTKPFLQIDIDHDYVNAIETDFIRLESAINTKEKTQSLTSVRLIRDNWKNIGSM